MKSALTHSATWYPEKEAFVQAGEQGGRYTFSAVNREARRFAHGLDGIGIGAGDVVAFLSPIRVEHAIAYFGVSKIGGVPVTLHSREAPGQLAGMAARVGTDALVFHPEFADRAEFVREDVEDVSEYVCFDDFGATPSFARPYSSVVDGASTSEPAVEVTPDDVAFVNFTSGSTGEPDPIAHTHAEAIELTHNGYLSGIRISDTFVNAFSPAFIAWQSRMLTAACLGATIVLVDGWDPENILEVVAAEEVSVLKLVPTQWRQLVEAHTDAHDTGSVRMVGYAGGPISTALLERIRRIFTDNIRATYGTTEAPRSTALFPSDVTEETLGSVGKPLPQVEARLIEPGSGDPGAEVEAGRVGELVVRGPTVARSVWRDPDRTRELFHDDGWWFSGDLARVGAGGNLFIEGRVDNMIISGGINVYPEHVENVLESHPSVVECAVVGVDDERWGQKVKALVETAGDVSAADLDEWCRERPDLSNYQRPKEYEFVDGFPRTATGKIARTEL